VALVTEDVTDLVYHKVGGVATASAPDLSLFDELLKPLVILINTQLSAQRGALAASRNKKMVMNLYNSIVYFLSNK
jgi:hypothetical protein